MYANIFEIKKTKPSSALKLRKSKSGQVINYIFIF